MTSINSNTWYEIVYSSSVGAPSGLEAQDINDTGTGAIITIALNSSSNADTFHWQLVLIDQPDTYLVRSRFLGNQYIMGAYYGPDSNLPGMDTRILTVQMGSNVIAANQSEWIITSTNDGTGNYYFSTVANGTSWHLEDTQGIGYLRSASAGAAANSMKWSINSVAAINDPQWSYSSTATSSSASTSSTSTTTTTASSTKPASNTAASTAAASTSSPNQGALTENGSSKASPGAIAGGVVGGVAVLLLIFGFLAYCYRKRRRQVPQGEKMVASPDMGPGELEGKQVFSSKFGTFIKHKPEIVHEKAGSPVPANPAVPEKHPAYRGWDERAWDDAVELPTNANISSPPRL